MAWYPCKGGTGMPSGLQTEMDAVLNKKFGTSTTYPAEGWPDDVNLLGLLPLKTATKAAICSFNDGADDVPCSSAVCEINPVQAGTGDPSPSNPRAISGFTGLTLYRSAATPVNGVYIITPFQSGSGTPSPSNPCPISAGLTFTMDDSSTMTVYGGILDVFTGVLTVTHSRIDLGSLNWSASGSRFFAATLANVIKVPASNGTAADIYCEIYVTADYMTVYNNTQDYAIAVVASPAASAGQVSIRDSSASGMTGTQFKSHVNGKYLVYERATPQTYQLTQTEIERAMNALSITAYPVTWQTEAGTVYGGSLDVVSGVLTVTYEKKQYNGGVDEEWLSVGEGTNRRFRSALISNAGSLVMSSHFVPVNRNSGTWGEARITSGYLLLLDNSTQIADVTALKTWLATNQPEFVLELATPVTYQLTPQEVSTLLGTNNFYHDANGDTQITYRATSAVVDTKTITANGTYNASADNLDGYSAVSVNVAPNVGTKNITNNGTYNASTDSLDGYSSVTVNVSGGGTTLTLHEGKIDSSGNFTTDTDYYYTDEFDCPSGDFMMDFGFTGDQDYTGLRFWTSGGTFIDYWSATSRYRFIPNAQYYQSGAKARLSFPKSALNAVLYLDCATNKIISNLDKTGLEE